MQSEIWCSVFSQVQVPTIMKSGSGHSIFFQNQSSGNHAVRNWMFWSGNNRIVRSQVDVSDNHAVRNLEAHFLFMSRFLTNMQSGISTWVLLKKHHNFRFSGTCGVWLPWVVSLQGGRHLYRLIQAASIGVNLQLWRHLDTKAKEKAAVLSSPHQRSPFVTRLTTAICGEFWETFATGRAHVTTVEELAGKVDVCRLVPFAAGQTCWVGRRNIWCSQCRQIQPSSSPGQDFGLDAYKDYEQKFLAVCSKWKAVFFPLGVLHRFVLEWRWAIVASDATICIIYHFKRRIRHRSSHSRGSQDFCFSRLCRLGHHYCLPGGYWQTFVWARNRSRVNSESTSFSCRMH